VEQALIVQQLVQYSVCSKSPLGLIFVDLNKAYDRVDRKALWEDMAVKLNIPPCLIQIIRNMYINNKGIITIEGQEKHSFDANTGVK
jgi:hypothetical protein